MGSKEQKVTGIPVLPGAVQPCHTGMVSVQEESPITSARKMQGWNKKCRSMGTVCLGLG